MLRLQTRSRWRHDWPKFDLHDRSVSCDSHAAGQTTIIPDAFTSLTLVPPTRRQHTRSQHRKSNQKTFYCRICCGYPNPLSLLRRNCFVRVHPCVLRARREFFFFLRQSSKGDTQTSQEVRSRRKHFPEVISQKNPNCLYC